MTTVLSGPMFEPSEDEWCKSVFKQSGGHYNVFATKSPEAALALLRYHFPTGEANELNFVLFSTSGVHGSYETLEKLERSFVKYPSRPSPNANGDLPDDYMDEVTFLLVKPRLVSMTYGNCAVRTLDDIGFLKKLRASSWAAMQTIGKPEKK